MYFIKYIDHNFLLLIFIVYTYFLSSLFVDAYRRGFRRVNNHHLHHNQNSHEMQGRKFYIQTGTERTNEPSASKSNRFSGRHVVEKKYYLPEAKFELQKESVWGSSTYPVIVGFPGEACDPYNTTKPLQHVCDPDYIMGPEAAKNLDEKIDEFYKEDALHCPCVYLLKEKREQYMDNGLVRSCPQRGFFINPVVAIASFIEHEYSDVGDDNVQAFAQNYLAKNNHGKCGNGMVMFLAAAERLMGVAFGSNFHRIYDGYIEERLRDRLQYKLNTRNGTLSELLIDYFEQMHEEFTSPSDKYKEMFAPDPWFRTLRPYKPEPWGPLSTSPATSRK